MNTKPETAIFTHLPFSPRISCDGDDVSPTNSSVSGESRFFTLSHFDSLYRIVMKTTFAPPMAMKMTSEQNLYYLINSGQNLQTWMCSTRRAFSLMRSKPLMAFNRLSDSSVREFFNFSSLQLNLL
ncbi:hypothetical protein BRARA_F01597 [Brassica rapa]|uniref:Uncharacterized protein n=1 Tax=Brassica campestris TaxID=3711 RepID=A0A397YYE7_BRACM|nr:hypothetical protein BRARA_F01597 [Brassica rapa]